MKTYFSLNKKHGSTDRKTISHLCYCYFRLGKAFTNFDFEEKIKIAYFLCNIEPKQFSFLYDDDFINNWNNLLHKKIEFITERFSYDFLYEIFCCSERLSKDIEQILFFENCLIQPKVFARIRPNKTATVINKLKANNINHQLVTDDCIAFEAHTKLDEVLQINKEIIVQDYSSQQIEYFIHYVKNNIKGKINLWDSCAASGGKSILAFDTLQNFNLTVSDIRPSIIANLRKRFEEANIKNYQSFVANASEPGATKQKFNFIIADVPCTGSGTWSRTPENLTYFNCDEIEKYNDLQKKICDNTISQLQTNSYFLYITCSVFEKENDDVIDYILQHHHNLKLIEKKYFIGYKNQADTMFGALFIKQ